MTIRGNRIRPVLVCVILLLSSIPISNVAQAGIGDIMITGTVTDPLSRALSGVRITDGGKNVWSDANGQFSIQERVGSSFLLTAMDVRLVEQSLRASAIPGVTVDFIMKYKLTASLTPVAFNNSSPKTVTVTAKTYAPPDSCVNWTDQSSGTVVVLQRDQSVAGPEYVWTESYAVPSDQPDASYASSVMAKSCSAETPITQVLQLTYTIDSVTPSILHALPGEGANTVYGSQPVAALLDDGAAGEVTSLGVTFTMTDMTPDPGQQVTQTSKVSSHFRGKWAISPPFILAEGHTYSLTVDALDRAGNHSRVGSASMEDGGGLTRISPDFVTPHVASIRDHGCDLLPDPDSPLYKMALCKDVPLSLANGAVDIEASRHSYDLGFVRHTVRFDGAKLKSTVSAGTVETPEEIPARNSNDSLWDPRTMVSRFTLPAKETLPLVVPLSAESTVVPLLKVRNVPLYWQNARLALDSPSEATFDTCPNPVSPSGELALCSSDPFANRYTVELKPGPESVLSIAAQHLRETLGSFDLVQDDSYARWYELEADPLTLESIRQDDRVESIVRARSVERLVRVDSSFRALVSVPKADSEILQLYRNPTDTLRHRKGGALLTLGETAELDERDASLADSSIIREWVSANFHQGSFGGTYFDHSVGKLVVAFTANAQQRVDELSNVVTRQSRLSAKSVTWTFQELEAKAEEVEGAIPALALDDGIYVHFVSPRARTNSVVVHADPGVAVESSLKERFGESIEVIQVAGGELDSTHDGASRSLCTSAKEKADVDCGGIPDDERIARSTAGYIAGAKGLFGSRQGLCTLGFTMFDNTRANPHYGIFSAGHCGEPGEKMANAGKATFRVIEDYDFHDSNADILWGGLTTIDQTSYMIITGAKSGVPVLKSNSSGYDEEGSRNCVSGFSTGFHCGVITDTNATWCPTDDEHFSCNDKMVVFESSKNSAPGDSGAPVWHPRDGGAYAAGSHTAKVANFGTLKNNLVYTKWSYMPDNIFVKP